MRLDNKTLFLLRNQMTYRLTDTKNTRSYSVVVFKV